MLNPEQQEAVFNHAGPLLIVAGAGSGKTRVITQRIIEMLEAGINQSAILALTFSNKAAREMVERVEQGGRRKYARLTISTFHSFGVRILKKHIDRLGWRNNFSIYDSSDQKSLIRNCARELVWSFETLNIDYAAHIFSLIKTGRRRWDDVDVDISLKPLYEEYQSSRKLSNALDFDDLISLPIHLFKAHADILAEYHDCYRYIMIDEFQDTSMQQYELMKLLAEARRNICVVGDDDQSIYSWRGANFSNLQNFERDFSERVVIKLEQNYRSTDAILKAANHLIKNNKQRKKKELWTGTEGGQPIELFQPDDERMEAQWICAAIQTARLREGLAYHDAAVLIRTNGLSRALEEEFRARRVPYQISGGSSFFERAEIRDVLAYLRCISNSDDDVSLLRILNTPRRGLGKKTLEVLRRVADAGGEQGAGPLGLYRTMKKIAGMGSAERQSAGLGLGKRTLADIEDFINLVDNYRPRFLTPGNLAATLRELLVDIDYWGYLRNEFQHKDQIAGFRWTNIESLTDSLERWEDRQNKPSVFDYLNSIALAGRESSDEDGKVNLMTIHAAKGLEFDLVFIAGVEDNIIPHRRSLEEDDEVYMKNLEEERRIFYVALTRAKKKLYLTSCRQRRILRKLIDMDPSPFLAEIPAELIKPKEPESEVSQEEGQNYFALIKAQLADGTD